MPPDESRPEEVAAYRAFRRREMYRHLAWKRHARVALAQKATGTPGRAFNHLEARLARLMDEWGVDYQWQFRLGRYLFDFLLPGRLLVEVNGTYWHADPRFHPDGRLTPTQRRNVARDRTKADFAIQRGYRVKVVWESDLREGRVAATDLRHPEPRLAADQPSRWPLPRPGGPAGRAGERRQTPMEVSGR